MDLRTLLGGSPEPEVRYDDLTKSQMDLVTSNRASLGYIAQDLDALGRETGHPELIHIASHVKAACVSLALIEAGVEQQRRRAERENPTVPAPVQLEGKEGGN